MYRLAFTPELSSWLFMLRHFQNSIDAKDIETFEDKQKLTFSFFFLYLQPSISIRKGFQTQKYSIDDQFRIVSFKDSQNTALLS